LKELIDTFPHLLDTLDIVHKAILNELNFPEEEVDLNAANLIRKINKIVPRFSKDADRLER
jgi:hypothetical protein